MKEYIKIQTGESQIVFKDFRIAYGTLMPVGDKFRLDIDIATFGGQYNQSQIDELESEFQTTINTKFDELGIKITFATVNSTNLKECEIQIENGCNEDEGLVALQLEWAIYLRNIKINFEEFNDDLFMHMTAESEDIESYSKQGVNTTYEMTAKINSLKQVVQYPEIIEEGRKYMNLNKRYNEILSKLKGQTPKDAELSMISKLDREIEYKDSIWAWSQVYETIKKDKLIDDWSGKPIDNNR
jgi:hypothetical protein